MSYIDFKTTIWERMDIPDKYKDELIEKVKSGEIQSANDCFGIFGSEMDDNYELLLYTSEQMTPEENDGFPTIEIHSSENLIDDEIIWDNGRKEEENKKE